MTDGWDTSKYGGHTDDIQVHYKWHKDDIRVDTSDEQLSDE